MVAKIYLACDDGARWIAVMPGNEYASDRCPPEGAVAVVRTSPLSRRCLAVDGAQPMTSRRQANWSVILPRLSIPGDTEVGIEFVRKQRRTRSRDNTTMGAKSGDDRGLCAADVSAVFKILAREMPGRVPGAKGPKGQPNPFRACISCMLSAQSRDENAAVAAAALFALARTPRSMLRLSLRQISAAIKPCGLYNVKARNIHRFCAALLADFDGVVPETRDELMRLPGIGRKCADIVLQFAFGHDTIAVDTHVHRVCNRTGLAVGKTAAETAVQLEQRAPEWARAEGHFWLIQFGKTVCLARSPRCTVCPLQHLCRYKSAEQTETT